jgi:hypothetical protein
MDDVEMMTLNSMLVIATALMAMVCHTMPPEEADQIFKSLKGCCIALSSVLVVEKAIRECPIKTKVDDADRNQLQFFHGYWEGVKARMMENEMTSGPTAVGAVDRLIDEVRGKIDAQST